MRSSENKPSPLKGHIAPIYSFSVGEFSRFGLSLAVLFSYMGYLLLSRDTAVPTTRTVLYCCYCVSFGAPMDSDQEKERAILSTLWEERAAESVQQRRV